MSRVQFATLNVRKFPNLEATPGTTLQLNANKTKI